MRKLHFTFLLCLGNLAFDQQDPTGTPHPNINYNDWFRGGNSGNILSPNIFGTMWNSPIYTQTNGVNRMKLNGAFTSNATQYNIDGYSVWGNTATTVNTTGYLLLGPNAPFQTTTGQTIYNDKGAYSLLHLNGSNLIQQNGYRPWMKTGITFTDNQDLSYIGLRKVGTGLDITETTINWSDNAGPGQVGPDDFVIRFTGAGTNSVLNSTDYRASNDLDGIHIGRFTGFGLFGLGNTFGIQDVNDPINLYARPQSLFHASYDWQNGAVNEKFGFMQITYRRPYLQPNDIIGQGEAASDGLRFGIDNDVFSTADKQHLNSYLRWQEASSFIIQTEDNNSSNIQQNERLRVTSIGALAANYDTNTYIGLKTPTQVSRISISHNGGNALSRPMSLMHLGYNIGSTFGPYHLKFGWREWMDLGMLVSNNTDNVYIGLKPRTGVATANNNEMDAVISWGNDAEYATASAGIDVMSFIYTAEPLSSVDSSAATSQDGLEVVRMYPGKDTTFTYLADTVNHYGRVGIGDFTITGVNQQPTHKLDVVGNGRFRYLPDSLYIADSLVNKYVMVDSAGVLRWSAISPGGFGAACADTVNGKLQFDTKVDLNNHNLYFTNNDTLMTNQVGIGYDCGVNLPGKLSVRQVQDTNINYGTIGGHFWNSDTANVQNLNYIGVLGRADGKQIPGYRIVNTGGDFYGSNADINYGIIARGKADSMSNSINTGGQLLGAFGTVALGSVSQGSNASLRNVGVHGIATSPNIPSSLENIAGQFSGSYSTGTNYGIKTGGYGGNVAYGIYATALGAGTNFSGYFDGVINSTAAYVTLSDSIFKTDVNKVESALRTISKLQPKTYMMDTVNYSQFNFDHVKQYGFIAQEVEQVLPELVHTSIHPGVYDSLGNELIAPVEYKALNYQAMIPLNTQAIKELDVRLEKSTLSDQSIKTNVADLSGSLQKVLDMRGVTYEWEGSSHPNLELDSNAHIGFIAQEIHAIDPLLTFMDEDTLMHVEYDKVVPILAEAISELNSTVEEQDSLIDVLQNENQAQQTEIDDLNARLTQLENCLSGILPFLCQMNNSAIQPTQENVQEQLRAAINVTLSNRNNIILNQNVPNPFAESTVITFSIPATVQKAQIHFYDGTGKLINSVEIVERGNGQLNVFANDLSSGVYTYSLVADGQIVATKRMMKQ